MPSADAECIEDSEGCLTPGRLGVEITLFADCADVPLADSIAEKFGVTLGPT